MAGNVVAPCSEPPCILPWPFAAYDSAVLMKGMQEAAPCAVAQLKGEHLEGRRAAPVSAGRLVATPTGWAARDACQPAEKLQSKAAENRKWKLTKHSLKRAVPASHDSTERGGRKQPDPD